MRYDVVIVGGGVVGCAVARELSRFNLRVALVDKECEVGFGTSKSNSGIVHAGHHAPEGTLKGSLVVEGSQAFPKLAEELGFGFRRIGELVVARGKDEIPVLHELLEHGNRKGVQGLELWDRDRLRRAEPNLSLDLVAALHAPTAGVINPYEYCFNLTECARRNGVELFVESPVDRIEVRDGFLTLRTPSRLLHARYVINAAGVFADEVARLVGLDDFTIRPRKGEEYMLDKRMKGVVRRLIFPVPTEKSKGTLVIPTFDGTIMVGPTATDVDSKSDLSTSDDGAAAVFDFVRTLLPSINPRDTIAEFAGLRAVSSTNDFIIGPTSVPGFINVAGIQSPGLTATPAIARMVREILVNEGLVLHEKGEWDPYVPPIPRFSHMTTEEKLARAEADPRWAHIVCRCEEVTEAEVAEAIDRGARTLDGLKFRVRAGMGRCQGGFCVFRSMRMLSEELGVPLDEVTKRGGDSRLVYPRRDGER